MDGRAKLRIGILCSGIASLSGWELRAFDRIMRSRWGEIVVVVDEANVDPHGRSQKCPFPWRNPFGRALFAAAMWLERRLFRESFPKNADGIRARLFTVASLSLADVRIGHTGPGDAEMEAFGKHRLDVLLDHVYGARDASTGCARHGIWSLRHGEHEVDEGGLPGLWEVVQRRPVTEVSLRCKASGSDRTGVIDKAYFSTRWSAIRNYRSITECSVTLLTKNLRLLWEKGWTAIDPVASETMEPPGHPDGRVMLSYIAGVLKSLAQVASRRLLRRVGRRPLMWTLFLGDGSLLTAGPKLTTASKPGSKTFWADPFTIEIGARTWLLFENYDYRTGVGHISYGLIQDGEVRSVGDALRMPYHLSYPFIIERDGNIYMMPDTGSERLEVWRALRFPDKWELHATAFDGDQLADPTMYVDRGGVTWLLVSRCGAAVADTYSELYIYRVDGPDLQSIEPHSLNPVLIDSRGARGAGPMFVDHGRVIRPSQYDVGGVYGYAIRLSEIVTLTIDEFEERELRIIRPDFAPGLVGTHHLCHFDGGYLLDGCFAAHR